MTNTNIFYKTPFVGLNELTCGGFRPGSLVVVGGSSGMGKTSFLVSMLEGWHHVKTGIISLEQSAKDLIQVMESNGSEVPLTKILTNQTSAEEFQRKIEYINRALDFMIQVSDSKEDLWNTIEEAITDGCQIIMIDSLQRMCNKIDIYQEMSLIVNRLREISIKNNVCIIVTSQINRKVSERTGHRPQISDLRDSGYIEECADQILLLLRKDYYDPHDKPGQAELIIAKNRYGNTGIVNLAFRKEIYQFVNLAPFVPMEPMQLL